MSLERPDEITASAVSARDEIGRAIADKIRDLEKARDLKKVAEEVLPEIEKFLESPQERRLRGIRTGIVTSAAGLGGTVFFLVWGLFARDMFFLMGLGVTAFLIGVGLILNALLFTVPKQYVPHLSDLEQRNFRAEVLDRIPSKRELRIGEQPGQPASVTEQTTHHLAE
ncbi:MAG TPA: hypothetical protein VKN18_06135 [Blastocatellia bacterium]|nr:hypothetical protein [Blastocatellia bacterium]